MSVPTTRVPHSPKKFWWMRAKLAIRSQLAGFPFVQAAAASIWRSVRFLLLKTQWGITALVARWAGIYDRALDIDKVCWVSPDEITYCSLQEFALSGFQRRVMDGNWDALEKRFEDLDVYDALKRVCVEGQAWTETIYYRRILDAIQRGQFVWECRNQSDLDRRCEFLVSLFRKIWTEGYRSQRELLLSQKAYDPFMLIHEIQVNIGREGDLLFNESAHRLAISKLLGVPQIPVRVAIRHAEWIEFRKEVIRYVKALNGQIDQPLMHPDLGDIPLKHPDCEDTFSLIRHNTSVAYGRLLDIGANIGYFCHRFEEEGFDCYAWEDSAEHRHILEKLKRARNKRFVVTGGSALDFEDVMNLKFDVVLALRGCHRFLKTKESGDQFLVLLDGLQTRELFFECPLPGDSAICEAYKAFSPEQFADFLTQNTRLKNAALIGTTGNGTHFYKIY